MKMDLDGILDITEKTLKKAGFSWIQVFDTKRLNGDWQVKVDVGIGERQYLILIIDDATGTPKSITQHKPQNPELPKTP